MEFKVGDRVRIVEKGITGTIYEVEELVLGACLDITVGEYEITNIYKVRDGLKIYINLKEKDLELIEKAKEPTTLEELLKEKHIEKFPKLKKLKDLTFEEYKKWTRKNCTNTKCSECPFKYASCDVNEEICWINGKNMYSNEFLNQEIEIEQ